MWLWLLIAIVLGLVFMICRDAECWSEGRPVSPPRALGHPQLRLGRRALYLFCQRTGFARPRFLSSGSIPGAGEARGAERLYSLNAPQTLRRMRNERSDHVDTGRFGFPLAFGWPRRATHPAVGAGAERAGELS
jgi:hypothetical protein